MDVYWSFRMGALTSVLAGSVFAISAVGAEAVRFTITNPATVPVSTTTRVSLPILPRLIPGELPAQAIVGAKTVPVQATAITRHPDGSARRVMLSLPVDLRAGQTVEGGYPVGEQKAPAATSVPGIITTDHWSVIPKMERVELRAPGGDLLATITPFGPDAGQSVARISVLDSGLYAVWLRYERTGAEWAQQVDVTVKRSGEINLIHRIQAKLDGDHWTPDFGWELTATGAQGDDLPTGPRTMLKRNLDSHFADEGNADLVAGLILRNGAVAAVANPLALRQNRGTFEAKSTGEGVSLRSNRNEPVGNLETEGLMIQEGAWRFSELVVAPLNQQTLAARLDAPVYGHASWQAYDAVYSTGPPLQLKHPALRDCVEKTIFALQDMQMKGDDLGSMPWSWAPQRTKKDYTSAVRLNHSLYVWEDWFRGGDPRLRLVAHDWCRNYCDLGMYWGPNQKVYGACRRGNAWRNKPGHGPGTFNPRFDSTPIFVHKGWSNFWLMFEETGDPRYRHAAEAAAEWSSANQHAGLRYTRTIGVVTDAVKMYEYTGDAKHLANAVRLWQTFQPTQGEDLLFTESGKPAIGNHLYIGKDALGYKTPFVKPYIVQYATNALPYLLRHTPEDSRLHDTIIALNDWMAHVQQPGGGWGYPHAAAAGLGWNMEYTHGLMLAHEVEAKEEYLTAAARNLRPIVQLCELHGWPASGINPWEFAAKINVHQRQERYKLATDRDASRDYDEGKVRFGQSPDWASYFQVLLRDYLLQRDEASLFEVDELMEKIRRLPTTLR